MDDIQILVVYSRGVYNFMDVLFNKFLKQNLTPLNSLFLLKPANSTPAGI